MVVPTEDMDRQQNQPSQESTCKLLLFGVHVNLCAGVQSKQNHAWRRCKGYLDRQQTGQAQMTAEPAGLRGHEQDLTTAS